MAKGTPKRGVGQDQADITVIQTQGFVDLKYRHDQGRNRQHERHNQQIKPDIAGEEFQARQVQMPLAN